MAGVAVTAAALAGAFALSPALAASVALNDGAVTIAVAGAKDRLRFFWAANGSATWPAETVAGPGSVR